MSDDLPTWAYRFREADMDYCDDHELFAAAYIENEDCEVTIVWWSFDD